MLAELVTDDDSTTSGCDVEAHAALNAGDVAVSVLSQLPPLAVGQPAAVCKLWYEAADTIRDTKHGPMLRAETLKSVMAAMPTLCTLGRCAAVCSVWRAAACSERVTQLVSIAFSFFLSCRYLDSVNLPTLLSCVLVPHTGRLA